MIWKLLIVPRPFPFHYFRVRQGEGPFLLYSSCYRQTVIRRSHYPSPWILYRPSYHPYHRPIYQIDLSCPYRDDYSRRDLVKVEVDMRVHRVMTVEGKGFRVAMSSIPEMENEQGLHRLAARALVAVEGGEGPGQAQVPHVARIRVVG